MTRAKRMVWAFVAVASFAGPALTQEADVAPDLQCLRYLQSYERGMRIPQGLLTAISFVEAGRSGGANGQLMAWPWTININGEGRFFETKEEAVADIFSRPLKEIGIVADQFACFRKA